MPTKLSVPKLIGKSVAYRRLLDEVERIAPMEADLLLRGESGTGKSSIARVIHNNSSRRHKIFCELNCSVLNDNTLLESELFGHEKGAFTDAKERKIGIFELARGGTLFLDEIGELSPAIQAKLLHVLEHKQIRRLGGTSVISCTDVRIIYATHQDIINKFRADFRYRITRYVLEVPRLRERREDIPALVTQFFDDACADLRRLRPFEIRPDAYEAFLGYDYPGNIRQLSNIVYQIAFDRHGKPPDGVITAAHVLGALAAERREEAAQRPAPRDQSLRYQFHGDELDGGERLLAVAGDANTFLPPYITNYYRHETFDAYVARVLIEADDFLTTRGLNVSQRARLLGINRSSFYRRVKEAKGALSPDARFAASGGLLD